MFGLFRVAVIAQQVYKRYLAKQTTNKAFRLFGLAVVMLELRCRRRSSPGRTPDEPGARGRPRRLTQVDWLRGR